MAYGTYYRGAPTMGDMVNPRRRLMDPDDPRYAGGVNQTQAPPSGGATPSSWQTRTPQQLAADRDAWDAEFRALPPGGSMNRQRPGTEGSVDPRDASPESGYGPGGVSNPAYTTPPPPHPNAPPGSTPSSRRSHAYTGSALAYYGTGDIDGSEDVAGGSHASTGVNTAGWTSGERGSRSIKNVSMKIATRYPPKPSSIDLWLADPDTQRFFPNAKKVGFDKVDFGDGKPVDVLKNADPASDSAEAWAFQPESESVPTGAGAGQTAARGTSTPANPSTLDAWGRAPGHPDFGKPPQTDSSGPPPPPPRYTGPSFRDWVDGDWRAGRGER